MNVNVILPHTHPCLVDIIADQLLLVNIIPEFIKYLAMHVRLAPKVSIKTATTPALVSVLQLAVFITVTLSRKPCGYLPVLLTLSYVVLMLRYFVKVLRFLKVEAPFFMNKIAL